MVIRLYHRHSLLVCVCVLAAVVGGSMFLNFRSHSKEAEPAMAELSSAVEESAASEPAKTTPAVAQEMRAVWVPYMSIDMSREEDKSEAAFKKKFDAIVAGAKEYQMNTLIVHVRPFADSLYPSQYFPWSHLTGGTQGVNPGYDPMKYMVEATHKAGMEFHAWINPLRVQISGTPSILAQTNPYTLWKNDSTKSGWIVQSGDGLYLNPAYPQVRKLVADGAQEIAKKYDVDAIQFDDYFYPTQEASFDETAYTAYAQQAQKSGTALSLMDWRRANINALIAQTYQEIKSAKPSVQFGIAPQGNIENNLKIGADVAAWCSVKGYVDYICPQLYVNFENPVLPFDAAAQTWKKMVTNPDIKFYLGLAVYKAGSDADEGTWKKSSNILAEQVSLGRRTKCDGFMFYSWDYLNKPETQEEVQNVIKLLK